MEAEGLEGLGGEEGTKRISHRERGKPRSPPWAKQRRIQGRRNSVKDALKVRETELGGH